MATAQPTNSGKQKKSLGPVGVCRLLFLRHGDADVPKLEYPNHNTMPLSPLGVSQAQEAASYLAQVNVDTIVTSPFRRAVETADIVAGRLGVTVSTDDRLKERTVEALYGVPYDEIENTFGRATRIALETGSSHKARIPDTETMQNCEDRMASFLSDIATRRPHTALVVAHGGPHDWLLGVLLQVRTEQRAFTLGKCRLSAFSFDVCTAKLGRIYGINLSPEDYVKSIYSLHT